MLREITYADLIDYLYDFLGYDRSKYDLKTIELYTLYKGFDLESRTHRYSIEMNR